LNGSGLRLARANASYFWKVGWIRVSEIMIDFYETLKVLSDKESRI
jgi:hypothetical protein